MRNIVALGLLVFIASHSHAQPAVTSQAILARVGNRVITEHEFIERFELTPALNRQAGAKLDEEKVMYLYSMVAEKLLAEEAKRRGLDKDSIYATGMGEFRRLLARDELYRVEIARRVTIMPDDIRKGIRQALKQLLVEYLYFDTKADAQFVRSTLKKGRTLGSVAIDSSIAAIHDTATVIWGDADPAIEKEAYRLSPGEISPVVATRSGYYILRLVRADVNKFYAGMQASVLRERVVQTIRLRKERERLDSFLATTLQNKVGYGRPKELRAVVEALAWKQSVSRDSLVSLQPSDEKSLDDRCRKVLRDTLAVAGTRVWTTAEILEKLCSTAFNYERNLVLQDLAAKVNLQVRIWVQQELLAQEALVRNLDKSAEVARELEMWNDSFLAARMKDEIDRSLTVTDVEVWQSMHDNDSTTELPRVQLRELWTHSLDRMQIAIDSMSHGVPFPDVVHKFTEDSLSRSTDGITPAFSIIDRAPVGGLAWKTGKGNHFGPLGITGRYLYAEVIAKYLPAHLRDTMAQERFEAERLKLMSFKKRGRLNYFIAQLAEKEKPSVFDDRVRMLKVSPVPMMTFRVIGFGGRMFAVPFVDKQIEWLTVDLDKGQPLP